MCTEAIQVSCPQLLLLPQHTAKASAHRRPLSHPDTHSETHTQTHTHTDTHTLPHTHYSLYLSLLPHVGDF